MSAPHGRFPYDRPPAAYPPPGQGLPPASQPIPRDQGSVSREDERPDALRWLRGARPFDVCGSATLAAAGSAFTSVVSFDMPKSRNGILEFWGGQPEDVAGGDEIEWQVVLAGQPLPHLTYDRCGDWIGLAQSQLCRLYLPVPAGSQLEIRGKNHHSTDDFDVCARLKGTLWQARPGELS